MTTDKPSRNEDEYFARQEAELLAQRREQAQEAAAAAERASHHMKCPKCGYDLTTSEIEDVQIDVCTACGGVWLDQGELEQLTRKEEGGGLLRRVFNDVTAVMGGRRTK